MSSQDIPPKEVSPAARDWWFHVTPKETQKNGLMIVGIEGGLSKGTESLARNKWGDWCVGEWTRFVITDPTKQAKYRTKNIEWLKILGYDIQTDEPEKNENRIQSTNWLLSENRSDRNSDEVLVENTGKFLDAIDFFKPKVIMLMGKRLSVVLGDPKVKAQFESENRFGKQLGDPQWTYSKPNGFKKGFNFSYWEFEKCKVLGLPHPTGSHGLLNKHLAELPEPMLGSYKSALKEVFESGH